MKRAGTAFALVIVIVTGFRGGRIFAAQNHMIAARDHLRNARSELRSAVADKGGHRERAISIVDSAIAEVDAGIEYARTH
jgi:hypothetical protein